MKSIRFAAFSLAAAALALMATPAFAQGKLKTVYTGGEKGAYHTLFAPPIPDALSKAYFKGYTLTPSAGTLDNIQKVFANPQSIGFAQLDVYAREAAKASDQFKKLVVIRQLACEGVWMVTRGDIDDYGKVLGYARRVQFILPPQNSGSAATFEFLKQIDPEGIGRARNVNYVQSATDALKQTASSQNDVGMFVQFADPTNANIKLIQEAQLKVIPVVSREIVSAKVGDQQVYQVQTFSLTAGGFISSGKQVTTACTPVVIFTGAPDSFSNRDDRDDQTDMIRKIRELPEADLLPREGAIASIIKSAKTLTGPVLNDVLAGIEAARKKTEELTR